MCARKANGVEGPHGLRWCNAPYSQINAMSRNGIERKDAGLSATTILNACPRQVILQRENDYYERPKSYWARFRGTLAHTMMEMYDGGGEGIIQEVRFKKTVQVDDTEIEITGKQDYIDTVNKRILDFKSIKSINAKPINQGECKPEHALQLSLYRWLLDGGVNMDTNEVVHYEIDGAALLYFDMTGAVKVRAPLMSLDETEAFIQERVRPYVAHRDTGLLPPPITNDRGTGPHWLCRFCPVRDICDAKVQEGL